MQTGHKVTAAVKRVRNGRHKAAKCDSPVASSKYCPGAGKSKLSFESKQAADRYIRFNREQILRENGYAPVRSYRCPVCGCWHVSSQPRIAKCSDGTSPVTTPLSPELRRDTRRQLRHIEHSLEQAFRALSLCDMERAGALCDEARQHLKIVKQVPCFESLKQKLKDRLTYCLSTRALMLRDWMRRLCRVDYRPASVRYHQWYMSEPQEGFF